MPAAGDSSRMVGSRVRSAQSRMRANRASGSCPGSGRNSNSKRQWSGTMLSALPPAMTPVLTVQWGGSKPSANGPATLNSPFRRRSSVMIAAPISIAFTPR